MKATMLYGPKDVRFEDRPDPLITQPTDTIARVSVACVWGSDLWPHRGAQPINGPTPMGHELKGLIDPGKVFDLTLPLDQVAEGYRAMDERRAVKALQRP
jgi:threonine dehydrogenase-like Zn-dependent dehydrogenase